MRSAGRFSRPSWAPESALAIACPPRAFQAQHAAAIGDGALSTAQKELIALDIAIAVRCDGCIAHHVRDALQAGAGANEIVETIEVAVLMGGDPRVVYGAQAHRALTEFLEADASVSA